MKIITWQIITLIICIILGTILHFTYDWSGKNTIVGLFSATNESTWEHLKLIFYPMFFMAIIGYFVIGDKSNNYWLATALGILSAMFFTVAFFYTYTGIIGTNYGWINIATFVASIFLGVFVSYKLLISTNNYNAESFSIIFLVLLFSSFILYTFNPPQIALFKDPISKNT